MKTTSTTNEYTDEYVGTGGGHWLERTFIRCIDENRLIWHIREMVGKYTKLSDKCLYVNIGNGDDLQRACTPDEAASELFKFACMGKTIYTVAMDTYHELGKYAIWLGLAETSSSDHSTNIGADLIDYISSLMT